MKTPSDWLDNHSWQPEDAREIRDLDSLPCPVTAEAAGAAEPGSIEWLYQDIGGSE